MTPPKTIITHKGRIACAGQPGGQEHPQVFLEIKKPGWAVCPYCSQRFEYKEL